MPSSTRDLHNIVAAALELFLVAQAAIKRGPSICGFDSVEPIVNASTTSGTATTI
jgi:hypothetical protein